MPGDPIKRSRQKQRFENLCRSFVRLVREDRKPVSTRAQNGECFRDAGVRERPIGAVPFVMGIDDGKDRFSVRLVRVGERALDQLG